MIAIGMQSNDCNWIGERNRNSIKYYPGFAVRLSNVIHLFCNAGIPDLFWPICTPPFFVSEVNKAIFACVCLEKGSFLDFSQLLSYKIS